MPSTNQIKNQEKKALKKRVEAILNKNGSPLPPDLKEYLRGVVTNHLLTYGI